MQNKYSWRPANLSKALILFLLLGSYLITKAQDLSGLYTGTLTNDSTGRKQQFEIALSEYKGKITGYSYTTFIANDTFYYSIKRVEAERENGYLVVKDVKMENNNFPESPAKKVKQTAYFPLINDSTIDVARGRWETNRTRLFYSIGGKAELEKKEDDKQSSLLAHLSELGIESNLQFDSHRKVNYQEGKEVIAKNEKTKSAPEKPLTKIKEPKEAAVTPVVVKVDKPVLKPANEIKTGAPVLTAPVVAKESGAAKPAIVSETVEIMAKTDPATANTNAARVKEEPLVTKQHNGIAANDLPSGIKPEPPAVVSKPSVNPVPEKPAAPVVAKQTPAPPVNKPPAGKTETPVVVSKPKPSATPVQPGSPVTAKQTVNPSTSKTTEANLPVSKPAEPPVVTATPVLKPAELPVAVATRQNAVVQQLTFSSDSLIIALYDNGVVDGDSVSVFVNGSPVLEKAMLKISATKKTVYTSSYADSIQIVLFAENLGTIAPNTGLMTIRDGEQVHQVRFSADLNKNAAITLRRKRN